MFSKSSIKRGAAILSLLAFLVGFAPQAAFATSKDDISNDKVEMDESNFDEQDVLDEVQDQSPLDTQRNFLRNVVWLQYQSDMGELDREGQELLNEIRGSLEMYRNFLLSIDEVHHLNDMGGLDHEEQEILNEAQRIAENIRRDIIAEWHRDFEERNRRGFEEFLANL
ncbi:MAG: hypothetical protein IJJ04_02970 [Clostridia bacterium]|nr:hypothetical protein [Clostridia bacterium]